jgi:uncharacterized protein YbjT (DUF2867 family)
MSADQKTTASGTRAGARRKRPLVLVTGATGYIGGRLVQALLDAGYRVRCLARDPSRLRGRPWLEEVDAVRGDVLEPGGLEAAMGGVEAAFYLVHSMMGGEGYRHRDVTAARAFAHAAGRAGVKRVIYLGGLGDPDKDLSQHLRSRQETGDELRAGGPPVTEFRAAVVVGSGSVSFEMIRYLTERLPVMICPEWVYTRVQPIAARDVIAYLVAALEVPESAGRIVEIGGSDVLTYGEMMTGYAEVRGLNRYLIAVPVLTPRLSSYWVHLVTPIPSTIARPLIEGLRSEVVARDELAAQLFPDIHPLGYPEAVRQALDSLESGRVATSWTDALASSEGDLAPVTLRTEEGMMIERRQLRVTAPPHEVFETFCRVGGDWRWPYANVLWQLRGLADIAVGGVGLRRGRRDPGDLRVGDALDFWRVEAVEPDRLLRLRAEMKLPGLAWLQFEVLPAGPPVAGVGNGGSRASSSLLTQTAFFAPKGLAGLGYWYGLYPVHGRIFSGTIAELARRAEARSRGEGVEAGVSVPVRS